jgi:molybdopterin-guanine dinucleotide biosynthesis adapter protein
VRRLHIVGRKDHGKTTLIVELAAELTRRGLRVGTVKHSDHPHEPDVPESDSWRHRRAGGSPAAFVTDAWAAVFLPRADGWTVETLIDRLYGTCDIVIVEGYADGPYPKVEVWRAARGSTPLALERSDILAVVTDDPIDVRVPRWPRKDIRAIVDRLLELAK